MSSGPGSKLFKGLQGHIFFINRLCAGFAPAFEEAAGNPGKCGRNKSRLCHLFIDPADPWSGGHSRTARINPQALQPHVSFSHPSGLCSFLSPPHHSTGWNMRLIITVIS